MDPQHAPVDNLIAPDAAATLHDLAAGAAAHANTENFPVALRVLPPAARDLLSRIYAYARFVDEVGDSAAGDRLRLLERVELDVRAAASGTARISVVRALAPELADGLLPVGALLDLVEANRRDQVVVSYASFADLLDYCRLSAAPVGRLVLHAARAATAANVAASDRVCAALQVLEHCQDAGEDARAGRVYLPADDLAAAGVHAADLEAPTTSPELRAVIAVQVCRARRLLADGPALVARLSGWPRLAVAGYLAGGLATADALEAAGYDVLARRVVPRSSRTAWRAVPLLAGRPRSGPPADVQAAYAECERITREQARNFAWGIRLLPPAKRRALSAVYAFARRVDDIGDGDLPGEEKLRLLDEARVAVEHPEKFADDPVLTALADAAERFPVPLAAFDELISGCEMDVTGRSYGSIDELVEYCRCVAGSIGRLSLGVFDPPVRGRDADRASRRADALGVALQLTNILRDVREDLQTGRVYLPSDDLERFGCAVCALPDGSLDGNGGAFADLVRFEASRAADWYARGLQLLPMLDRRSAASCATMAGIYRALLARIAADPDAVRHGRERVPNAAKARIAARALAGRRG